MMLGSAEGKHVWSGVIDTAAGLVLIYLLLSLIVTPGYELWREEGSSWPVEQCYWCSPLPHFGPGRLSLRPSSGLLCPRPHRSGEYERESLLLTHSEGVL